MYLSIHEGGEGSAYTKLGRGCGQGDVWTECVCGQRCVWIGVHLNRVSQTEEGYGHEGCVDRSVCGQGVSNRGRVWTRQCTSLVTAIAVDGTHPTGIHSCSEFVTKFVQT